MIEAIWIRSELAFASYATLTQGRTDDPENQRTLREAGMSAAQAEEHIETVSQQKELPEDIPTITVSEASPHLRRLLVNNGLVGSMSEAVRLINQGAVKVDGERVTGFNHPLRNESVIQVGKLKYVKVIIPGA